MGAFNVLVAVIRRPSHDGDVELPIQFKYGSVAQLTYRLGDLLRWGGNDVGSTGTREVLIDGEAERCPVCRYNGDWPVRILAVSDTLVRAYSVPVETPDLPEGWSILVNAEDVPGAPYDQIIVGRAEEVLPRLLLQ